MVVYPSTPFDGHFIFQFRHTAPYLQGIIDLQGTIDATAFREKRNMVCIILQTRSQSKMDKCECERSKRMFLIQSCSPSWNRISVLLGSSAQTRQMTNVSTTFQRRRTHLLSQEHRRKSLSLSPLCCCGYR